MVIAGAAPTGFNGTYVILTASATTFTYFDPTTGLATSTAGGTVTSAGFALANAIQFNTGPGYLTLSGAQPVGLSGTFTGAGSLAVNMSTATTSVAIAGAGVGTGWTGLSNFINGQVSHLKNNR